MYHLLFKMQKSPGEILIRLREYEGKFPDVATEYALEFQSFQQDIVGFLTTSIKSPD